MKSGARKAAVALAVPLALALAACGSSGSSGSAGAPAAGASGGSFKVGVASFDIAHLGPGSSGDDGVQYAIWTPLTEVNPATGKLTDEVASKITSADNVHWTITIRKGWTFQNGDPVTAQSFADSWNSTAYGPNAQTDDYLFSIFAGYAAMNPLKGTPTAKTLSGVKVVNSTTLDVTLTSPLSQFPYVLSGTPFAPVPKQALANLTAFDKQPIGDGPYEVAKPGITAGATTITLNRYSKYAGTKGSAATITVEAFQDSSTAYTAFQSGAIDVTLLDSGTEMASASSQDAGHFTKVTLPAVVYLGFPLWERQFQSQQVREAFSEAVDRPAIVKALLQGFGVPATGIAPKSIAGGGKADCQYCTYNPAQAKQLLAAGGGFTGSLTLWTYQDPTMQPVLQSVLNELHENLGIASIKLQAQTIAQLYQSLPAHTVNGPFLLYLGASYPSVYSLVDSLFAAGGDNETGFSAAAVTSELTAAAAATSSGAALTDSQKAAASAMSSLPLTPLYFPEGGLVYASKLGNVHAEPLGDAALAGITVSG